MSKIAFSDHAKLRMKQKGMSRLEIVYVLQYAYHVIKTRKGRKVAIGGINNRTIKVVFVETKKHIKIITIR